MRHEVLIGADHATEQVLPLSGAVFDEAQRQLAHFNEGRLKPGLGESDTPDAVMNAAHMLALEDAFVKSARREIAPLLNHVPDDADAFLSWFEALKENGPGQNDALFPYLRDHASLEEMRWFMHQEVAGEAGFEDLVALTQIKMPVRAKLEMARNYWDEMGRGQEKGMHGPMLGRLAQYFDLNPTLEDTVAESLALGNMMMALGVNRRFAFHAAGALGVIELTAPGRAQCVSLGLTRLGIPKKESHYFTLHAVLWNAEVLHSMVEEDGRRARALAEGAILRLWCGARTFARYRNVLNGVYILCK